MITLTHKNKMVALLCGIAFLNLSLFTLGGEMPFVRKRQRIQERKKIREAEASAQIICNRKLPLMAAPSSCHCHAPNPVAIANGRVSAAPRRL